MGNDKAIKDYTLSEVLDFCIEWSDYISRRLNIVVALLDLFLIIAKPSENKSADIESNRKL